MSPRCSMLSYLAVTWVSWVLEPSEPSSKVLLLWQRTQQTQLKPGFLFLLMKPAKLGKLGLEPIQATIECGFTLSETHM